MITVYFFSTIVCDYVCVTSVCVYLTGNSTIPFLNALCVWITGILQPIPTTLLWLTASHLVTGESFFTATTAVWTLQTHRNAHTQTHRVVLPTRKCVYPKKIKALSVYLMYYTCIHLHQKNIIGKNSSYYHGVQADWIGCAASIIRPAALIDVITHLWLEYGLNKPIHTQS